MQATLILALIGFVVYVACTLARVPTFAEIGRLVGFAALLAYLFGH
jgi:hypothetical protein